MHPSSLAHDDRGLRVLHLIATLNPGGAEEVVVNLCRNRSRSVTTLVCSLSDSIPLASRLDPGTRVQTLGMEPRIRPANRLLVAKRLIEYVRKTRPHVVHSHLYGFSAPYIIPVARTLHVPLVTTLHTTGMHYSDRESAKCAAARNLERISIRLSRSAVVAVSNAVATTAAEALRLPPRRIEVIYNGIETTGRFQITATGDHRDPERYTCIYVARMYPRKAHATLIGAWRRIANVYPSSRLLLVGDGPLRTDLERQADALGLSHCISFLGVRDDVPDLLASADVGVFPSESEGLSLAAIEMMSAGLPVVCSDIPSLHEVVNPPEAGLSFPVGNEEELARALLTFAENPALRRETGQRARARALRLFSVSSMVTRYECVYRSLARMETTGNSPVGGELA